MSQYCLVFIYIGKVTMLACTSVLKLIRNMVMGSNGDSSKLRTGPQQCNDETIFTIQLLMID